MQLHAIASQLCAIASVGSPLQAWNCMQLIYNCNKLDYNCNENCNWKCDRNARHLHSASISQQNSLQIRWRIQKRSTHWKWKENEMLCHPEIATLCMWNLVRPTKSTGGPRLSFGSLNEFRDSLSGNFRFLPWDFSAKQAVIWQNRSLNETQV